jgi:hypothetical protein
MAAMADDHRPPGADVIGMYFAVRVHTKPLAALEEQWRAPTERNARTGEFTPPGMTFWDSSNNS